MAQPYEEFAKKMANAKKNEAEVAKAMKAAKTIQKSARELKKEKKILDK